MCLDLYNLAKIGLFTTQVLLDYKLSWPSQEDQESVYSQFKKGSVHSKLLTSGYNAWLTPTCFQVGDKQGANLQATQMFWGYWVLSRSPYHIQLDQCITLKETSCRPILVHLKEDFQQEIDKMPKWEFWSQYIKHPLINSFMLVEGRTSLAIWNLGSAWVPPILTRQ